MSKAEWTRLTLFSNFLIIHLNIDLHFVAICRANLHCKTLTMLSKRYRLRNCRSQRTHGDCESDNPVYEAVFGEIHNQMILYHLTPSLAYLLIATGNKKGIRRPLCSGFNLNYIEAERSISLRRIGRKTNQAKIAAVPFKILATQNTASQPPVEATSRLDKGTSNEAVPFAV